MSTARDNEGDEPVTEGTDKAIVARSVAVSETDGDHHEREIAVPDSRDDLIRATIYGSDVSPLRVEREYAHEPEFTALVRDQKAAQDAREQEHVVKLEPSTKGDPQLVETGTSRNPGDADRRAFISMGALLPPYDPGVMVHLFEHSNSLRQNVDAYATNIDGFGFRFQPTLNLESDDINEQVATAIWQDRVLAGEPSPAKPTPTEVKKTLEEIKDAMAIERMKLGFFFKNCVMNESFVTHRMKTRQDKEITGNAYWEVLRDSEGNIAQFILVPAHTVRINPQNPMLVPVEQNVQATPLTFTKRLYRRRFRTYLQIFENIKVFFKEFGDPRIISSRTGKVYPTTAALESAEEHTIEANELVHFAIHSSRGPYGVPRWIGTLLAVIGSRNAEEVNVLYFTNKSVPPLALLVSGGRVSNNTVDRIRDFIDGEIRGKSNFHKILVLEAEPAAGASGPEHTGRMKIELKPLTQAQHSDALFQNYDKENINKVGMSFRVPPLLRGDSRDFNRATAQAVLKFTETQVFAPERNAFDDVMNRLVLADMGICYHTFVSNSPKTTDPEDQAKVIERIAKTGALTPRDIRVLAEEILNTELKRIDQPWMDIPLPLATSGRIAELLEGPDDLFDPGSGTSTQTPLGGGKPASEDDQQEEDQKKMVEILRALASDALDAGRLQPAQANRLLRLPASIFSNGSTSKLAKRARRLLRIHSTLKAAELAAIEAEQAEDAIAKAKDELEPNGGEEPQVIQVPAEVWESFELVPEE